jgi:hypothetical protein
MAENNPRELGYLADWESMIHFALNLILTSERHKGTGIFGERIIITPLDHANELFMKAFLLKNGFVISYIEKNDLTRGEGLKLEDIPNAEKTIEYGECLKLVSHKVGFPSDKKERVLKFHGLRNEIQHRSTNIPLNKGEAISDFYPYLKELYNLMFPNFPYPFPEIQF